MSCNDRNRKDETMEQNNKYLKSMGLEPVDVEEMDEEEKALARAFESFGCMVCRWIPPEEREN